jgi:hypothetical protein
MSLTISCNDIFSQSGCMFEQLHFTHAITVTPSRPRDGAAFRNNNKARCRSAVGILPYLLWRRDPER